MAQLHKIPIQDAARRVTLRVKITGRRRFAMRLRLGAALIRLAAWVIDCGAEIEMDQG